MFLFVFSLWLIKALVKVTQKSVVIVKLASILLIQPLFFAGKVKKEKKKKCKGLFEFAFILETASLWGE